jgi:hypothetical protein
VPKYDRTHVVAEYIFNFFFGSVAVISLHYWSCHSTFSKEPIIFVWFRILYIIKW